MTSSGAGQEGQEKYLVRVDEVLRDLVDFFMNNRKNDIAELRRLLGQNDFATIQSLAHKVKGTGGGYGFNEVTSLAAEIENAATNGRGEEIVALIDRLENYLEKVQIVFVEEK